MVVGLLKNAESREKSQWLELLKSFNLRFLSEVIAGHLGG